MRVPVLARVDRLQKSRTVRLIVVHAVAGRAHPVRVLLGEIAALPEDAQLLRHALQLFVAEHVDIFGPQRPTAAIRALAPSAAKPRRPSDALDLRDAAHFGPTISRRLHNAKRAAEML